MENGNSFQFLTAIACSAALMLSQAAAASSEPNMLQRMARGGASLAPIFWN